MSAVSNTSPISNLASMGRLELLKSQFSTVFIPQGVAAELASHPNPVTRDRIEQVHPGAVDTSVHCRRF